MAYDFQVMDLMQRCENELVNRITASNVTDLLIRLFPHIKRQSKHSKIVEDDTELENVQATVLAKFTESMGNILSVA